MQPPPLFFPFAFLVIAGMIALALQPGVETFRENRALMARVETIGWVVEGEALGEMTAAPGLTKDMILDGGTPRVRIGAQRTRDEGAPSAGVFLTLPPHISEALSGRDLKIVLTARARPQHKPPDAFQVIALQTTGESSGWKTFQPTNAFAEISFEWAAPTGRDGRLLMVGVWPDTAGQGGELEIARIQFAPLDAASALRG